MTTKIEKKKDLNKSSVQTPTRDSLINDMKNLVSEIDKLVKLFLIKEKELDKREKDLLERENKSK